MTTLEQIQNEELTRVLNETGMTLFEIGEEIVETWDSDLEDLFSIPEHVTLLSIEEYEKVKFPWKNK